MRGGDFLKNPQGLNLLFCKPGTYLCSLFFILFFCFRSSIFLWKSDFFCFGVGVVLQGFQILGLDKKQKVNYKRFCPEPKFETLAALFDFFGVPGSVQYAEISVQLFWRWKAPQKNNANTTE